MEIPYDNGRILFKRNAVSRGYAAESGNALTVQAIVRAAVALLERLIAKVMQKIMDFAEKVVGKAVDDVKDTLEETVDRVHAKDELIHQQKKKKIPFPVNTHRKLDTQIR